MRTLDEMATDMASEWRSVRDLRGFRPYCFRYLAEAFDRGRAEAAAWAAGDAALKKMRTRIIDYGIGLLEKAKGKP
jgi:hypothetical protein